MELRPVRYWALQHQQGLVRCDGDGDGEDWTLGDIRQAAEVFELSSRDLDACLKYGVIELVIEPWRTLAPGETTEQPVEPWLWLRVNQGRLVWWVDYGCPD